MSALATGLDGRLVKGEGMRRAVRIPLTCRFVEALKELLRAELDMRQRADPACDLTWGEATILGLDSDQAFTCWFGGEDDRPEDFPASAGDVRVLTIGETRAKRGGH